jgi:pimeloyl-ACP methyl ester carboxylesterase
VPTVNVRGIDLYYDSFGDSDDPALLLIAGLGAQAIAWEDDLCHGFVDRGFRVVRYDHRDVGYSTWIDDPIDLAEAVDTHANGGPLPAPYLLSDLAADAVALLDALGIDRAHLLGISFGAMVAQQIAISHPERVQTLTSLMSTTGEAHVGQQSPEVLAHLTTPAPDDREAYLEHSVEQAARTSSAAWWDPDEARARLAADYDRARNPDAATHQMLAVIASGSRAEALAQLDVPTLVIHGEGDKVIDPSGGVRTAELIPDAELLLVPELGHDLPRPFWPQLIEAVTQLAARSAS